MSRILLAAFCVCTLSPSLYAGDEPKPIPGSVKGTVPPAHSETPAAAAIGKDEMERALDFGAEFVAGQSCGGPAEMMQYPVHSPGKIGKTQDSGPAEKAMLIRGRG